MGKGTGPSNLPDTAVGIFLSRLKKWAQKSPEAVETSGLFAAASIWVQLDGGDWRTRTVDLLRVKQGSNTAVLAARAEILAAQGFLLLLLPPADTIFLFRTLTSFIGIISYGLFTKQEI